MADHTLSRLDSWLSFYKQELAQALKDGRKESIEYWRGCVDAILVAMDIYLGKDVHSDRGT
jgi:hypothetical protein